MRTQCALRGSVSQLVEMPEWGLSLRRACGCKGKTSFPHNGPGTSVLHPVFLRVGHFSVTLLIIITMKILLFPRWAATVQKSCFSRGKSQVSNKRTSFKRVMLLLGKRGLNVVCQEYPFLRIRSVFEDGLCLSLCYKESQ